MPFAALDDGFWSHPKILLGGNVVAGVCARAWSYCAQTLTDGFVNDEISAFIATKNERQKVEKAGLWRPVSSGESATVITKDGERVTVNFTESGYFFDDYLLYNPSKASIEEKRRKEREKKAAQREQKRPLSPGDIATSPPGTQRLVPEGQTDVSPGVSPGESPGSRPRAGDARSRTPLPSPTSEDPTAAEDPPRDASPTEPPRAAAAAAELLTLLTAAKYTGPDLHTAEPDRALAWLRRGLGSPSVQNVGGFYRRAMEQPDHWPEPTAGETPARAPKPLYDRLANLIRNTGHQETPAGLLDLIADEERRTGQTLTASERAHLHNLHASITDPEPTPPPQRTPPPTLRSPLTQP